MTDTDETTVTPDPRAIAQAVLLEVADEPEQVGEFVAANEMEDHVTDFRFAAHIRGYEGWQWSVTLYHDPELGSWTVNESSLIPTEDALLPPKWIPWKDRLEPTDLSPTDSIGTDPDDERIETGEIEESSLEDVNDAAETFRLTRRHVLSPLGRSQAAKRWYDGPRGPKALSTKTADGNLCSDCGFFVPLTGELNRMFGVCANKWSPDDGRVVSLDHGCGEHSEIEPPEPSRIWVQSKPALDDLHIDIVAHAKTRRQSPIADDDEVESESEFEAEAGRPEAVKVAEVSEATDETTIVSEVGEASDTTADAVDAVDAGHAGTQPTDVSGAPEGTALSEGGLDGSNSNRAEDVVANPTDITEYDATGEAPEGSDAVTAYRDADSGLMSDETSAESDSDDGEDGAIRDDDESESDDDALDHEDSDDVDIDDDDIDDEDDEATEEDILANTTVDDGDDDGDMDDDLVDDDSGVSEDVSPELETVIDLIEQLRQSRAEEVVDTDDADIDSPDGADDADEVDGVDDGVSDTSDDADDAPVADAGDIDRTDGDLNGIVEIPDNDVDVSVDGADAVDANGVSDDGSGGRY